MDIDREEIEAKAASYRRALIVQAIERAVQKMFDTRRDDDEFTEVRYQILLIQTLTVDEILGHTLIEDLIALRDRLPAYIQEQQDAA